MAALHFFMNVLFALLAGWLTMWIATCQGIIAFIIDLEEGQ